MEGILIYKLIRANKLNGFPKGFWDNCNSRDEAIIILKYLIEDILKWNTEDIKQKLSKYTFIDNHLRGMLAIVFNDSPYQAINSTYPNKFREWELNKTPVSFWNENTAKEAVYWLIYEKLKWDKINVVNNFSFKLIKDNGLYGMIIQVFDGSINNLVKCMFGNEINIWEFKKVNTTWTDELINKAIRWLVEERMQYSISEAKTKLKKKHFYQYGLGGLIVNQFGCSPQRALDFVYK